MKSKAEQSKPKQNALLRAFRKVAFVGVASLALAGCVTTGPYVSGPYPGGGQYGSPTTGQGGYNNAPRGYEISYQAPRAPWANDPAFNREVDIYLRQANNNVRQQYANYQSRLATCNTNYTRALGNNQRQAERDRRNGSGWTGTVNSGARLNQATAAFNQCRVNAETAFERSHLNQQQSFDRNVENLNRKYARQYGVRW